MSYLNKFIDGPLVNGINRAGELKDSLQGASSSLVTITLTRGEWKEVISEAAVKGSVGAGVDGVFALYKASVMYKEGSIDAKTFATHLVSEIGCGYFSSVMGSAGSITLKVMTGSKTLSVVGGVGISVAARKLYRAVIPETVPRPDDEDEDGEGSEKDFVLHQVRDILNQSRQSKRKED